MGLGPAAPLRRLTVILTVPGRCVLGGLPPAPLRLLGTPFLPTVAALAWPQLWPQSQAQQGAYDTRDANLAGAWGAEAAAEAELVGTRAVGELLTPRVSTPGPMSARASNLSAAGGIGAVGGIGGSSNNVCRLPGTLPLPLPSTTPVNANANLANPPQQQQQQQQQLYQSAVALRRALSVGPAVAVSGCDDFGLDIEAVGAVGSARGGYVHQNNRSCILAVILGRINMNLFYYIFPYLSSISPHFFFSPRHLYVLTSIATLLPLLHCYCRLVVWACCLPATGARPLWPHTPTCTPSTTSAKNSNSNSSCSNRVVPGLRPLALAAATIIAVAVPSPLPPTLTAATP